MLNVFLYFSHEVDPGKAAELLSAAITIAAEEVLKQSQASERSIFLVPGPFSNVFFFFFRFSPCTANMCANVVFLFSDGVFTSFHVAKAIEIPEVLAAQFQLLAEAVQPSSPGTAGQGPCEDRLRPLLLSQRVLISRCLSLALPACFSWWLLLERTWEVQKSYWVL